MLIPSCSVFAVSTLTTSTSFVAQYIPNFHQIKAIILVGKGNSDALSLKIQLSVFARQFTIQNLAPGMLLGELHEGPLLQGCPPGYNADLLIRRP